MHYRSTALWLLYTGLSITLSAQPDRLPDSVYNALYDSVALYYYQAPDRSLGYLQEIQQLSTDTEDIGVLYNAVLYPVSLHIRNNNYEGARQAVDAARQLWQDHASYFDTSSYRQYERSYLYYAEANLAYQYSDYPAVVDAAEVLAFQRPDEFVPDSTWYVTSLAYLAKAYQHMGDYERALDLFRMRARIEQRKPFYPYLQMGQIALLKGDNELAIKHLKYSIQLLEEEGFTERRRSAYATTYGFLAKAIDGLAPAEQYLTQMKAYAEPQPQLVSYYHQTAGDVMMSYERHAAALDHYSRLRVILLESLPRDHPDVVATNVRLAQAYLANGEYILADVFIEQAYDYWRPIFEAEVSNYDRIVDKIGLLEVLELRGDIALARERPDFALEYYDQALSLLPYIRQQVISAESRRRLSGQSRRLYEAAIQAHARAFYQNEDRRHLTAIARYIGDSKNRTLLETTRSRNALHTAELPEAVTTREYALLQQLDRAAKAWREAERDSTVADSTVTRLSYAFSDANNAHQRFIDSLSIAYPRYHRLKYAESERPLDLLQQEARRDSCLFMDYFVGDTSAVMLMVDATEVRLLPLPHPDRLAQLIRDLRQPIEQRSLGGWSSWAAGAHEAYRLLIAPALGASKSTNRLVILPDGVLAYLPFGMLLTQPSTGDIYQDRMHFLLRGYAISYAYSNQLRQGDARIEAASPYAGFAPLYHDRQGIAHLPNTQRNVASVAQRLRGRAFTDTTATASRFRQEAGNHRILHLAMHTYADDRQPLDSRLLFSQSQDLTVDALFRMEVPADLAILSACNTGIGQLRKGEGLTSISRAFAYAGCPSTVMSLWSVPNESTGDITVGMMEYLQRGFTKDRALQRAQLDYLDAIVAPEQAHPLYWAGFVVVGDASAVDLTAPVSQWLWWGIGIGAVVLLVLVLVLGRMRRAA